MLNTLDLSQNEIGPSGFQHIAYLLKENSVSVTFSYRVEIYLSFGYLHMQIITILTLTQNQLGDIGVHALAIALENSKVKF